MSLDQPEHGIDARSIVTLILFFVVNALVIFPLRIPLPLAVGNAARRLQRAVFALDDPVDSSVVAVEGGAVERVSIVEQLPSRVSSRVDDQQPVPSAAASGDESYPPSRVLPQRKRRSKSYFELGLATAPVAGVLLLLASTCVPGSVVRGGIVGSGGGVRPYDIMTLFLSFAYISLSLDCTGLLRYLAFLVATKSSSSGRVLFSSLFALFVFLALIVGNDPIVLSGTPFVAYFTTTARIRPPTAFLFAQFQAANLASALLVSSNPTNLVLTASFHMSFLSFSAWTALPTVAAAVVLFPTLYLIFHRQLPETITPPAVNPRDALVDPVGAIFTTSIFISSIIILIALSAVGLLEGVEGVWTVTAPAALVVLARDCWYDMSKRKARALETEGRRSAIAVDNTVEMTAVGPSRTLDKEHGEDTSDSDNDCAVADETLDVTPVSRAGSRPGLQVEVVELRSSSQAMRRKSSTVVPNERPASASLQLSPPDSPKAHSTTELPLQPVVVKHPHHPIAWLRHTFPTASVIATRLPVTLLPFAFSMFILVDALHYTGWVGVWSKWWAAWARASGTAGCIWLMGVISVIGCNIFGTNIGVTVLMSRILVQWRDSAHPSNRSLYGSVLALAIGSNFGAYSFTFSASLAGLLWRDILRQKGLAVRAMEFLRWNALPLAVTMSVGCLVVGAEVCVMY